MKRIADQWKLLAASQRAGVCSVARTLQGAGFRAWLVGGAVRDLALGAPVGDLDMVSAATPDQVVALFPGAREVGRSFGIVQVQGAGQWVELATFRLERGYSDGRHPDEVRYTESLEEDAGRRDFTCNAMYWDPLAGELKDPKGGWQDLERGELACVGDAGVRFEEDGLRLLRMARFLARFDLKPAAGLMEAASQAKARLRGVSGERILEELRRMAEGVRPDVAIDALGDAGLLGLALTGGQSEELDQLAQRRRVWSDLVQGGRDGAWNRATALALLIAILLDPDPLHPMEPGSIPRVCKRVLQPLRTSTDLNGQVSDLWRLRSYFAGHLCHDSDAIRALREPLGPLALDLTRAWNREWGVGSEALHELLTWFLSLPVERVHPTFLPNGARLMELGVGSGPALGQLLRAVENAALAGLVDSEASALEWALSQNFDS